MYHDMTLKKREKFFEVSVKKKKNPQRTNVQHKTTGGHLEIGSYKYFKIINKQSV